MEIWKDHELSWNQNQPIESKTIPVRFNIKSNEIEVFNERGIRVVRRVRENLLVAYQNGQQIFSGKSREFFRFWQGLWRG